MWLDLEEKNALFLNVFASTLCDTYDGTVSTKQDVKKRITDRSLVRENFSKTSTLNTKNEMGG
jgi:hypothetical protein